MALTTSVPLEIGGRARREAAYEPEKSHVDLVASPPSDRDSGGLFLFDGYGRVAQLVAHLDHNQGVRGSSPFSPTINKLG